MTVQLNRIEDERVAFAIADARARHPRLFHVLVADEEILPFVVWRGSRFYVEELDFLRNKPREIICGGCGKLFNYVFLHRSSINWLTSPKQRAILNHEESRFQNTDICEACESCFSRSSYQYLEEWLCYRLKKAAARTKGAISQ